MYHFKLDIDLCQLFLVANFSLNEAKKQQNSDTITKYTSEYTHSFLCSFLVAHTKDSSERWLTTRSQFTLRVFCLTYYRSFYYLFICSRCNNSCFFLEFLPINTKYIFFFSQLNKYRHYGVANSC